MYRYMYEAKKEIHVKEGHTRRQTRRERESLSSFFCLLPIGRAGLNDLYSASQKTLESEMKLRKQLEEELDLVKSLKQEKEVRHLASVAARALRYIYSVGVGPGCQNINVTIECTCMLQC